MNYEMKIMRKRKDGCSLRCLSHTTYYIPHTTSSRGFTLLFAVLIGSLLFSVGMAIAHLAAREVVLSAAGKESEAAFFAADTGVECALYWDLRVGYTFPTSTVARRDSDGRIKCDGDSNVTLSFLPGTPTAATTTFVLALPYGCAHVTVGKTTSPERVVVESRGRNECGTGANPARVERALRVRY